MAFIPQLVFRNLGSTPILYTLSFLYPLTTLPLCCPYPPKYRRLMDMSGRRILFIQIAQYPVASLRTKHLAMLCKSEIDISNLNIELSYHIFLKKIPDFLEENIQIVTYTATRKPNWI